MPCVWCTGPDLWVMVGQENATRAGIDAAGQEMGELTYYRRLNYGGPYPINQGTAAWSQGFWFGIPEPQK